MCIKKVIDRKIDIGEKLVFALSFFLLLSLCDTFAFNLKKA